MLARILFVTDLHKRYKESASIKGTIVVQQQIQEDIINFILSHGITHVIPVGDWYDRGFHGLGPAYGAIEMDRRLSAAVDGRVFLCVGNHFYLERDENPEMYIIQPNTLFKPQINIPVPKRPIFQVVEKLKIGTVQIDFFHFNKINKDYIAYRDPDTTYHIGVYHDDATVPGWVREQEGFSGSATQYYMNKVYENIDLAIHGHIHTKIGMCSVQLTSGRKVPLCIPGAMCITTNKDSFKHQDVQLPILDIADDSSVSLKLATFKTYVEKLQFYTPKSKKKETTWDQINNLIEQKKEHRVTNASLSSLPNYMKSKGYGQMHMNLIDAAVTDNLNTANAVRILAEVDEIK